MTEDPRIIAYREAAVIYGDAQESGDSKRGNAAMDQLERLRDELQHDPRFPQYLGALLRDENRSVRLCAAVDALDYCPDDALRVLREIASGPRGMVRLAAEMVIQEWEAGRWPPAS